MDEVEATVAELGLPVVIRPSFTMGGLGSGMAHTPEDLDRIAGDGLAASPVHEVLIEESVLGWKEYELELMRDRHDNVVVVCSIENIDPMGVHTGDSRHRRAGDDAHRPGVPAPARPGHRRAARGRGGHRRLQHPVRGQPGRRPARRDRDEPAGVAVLGAGLEGDRLPDREDRREAGHRLHPRRDPQRHHPEDPGGVRAGARLRGGEDPAVRVREVPRRRPGADHHDEVGRRGDEPRAATSPRR